MKKSILILSAILAMQMSACNGQQDKPDEFRALNDSIVNVFQFASMTSDTVRLEEALKMSDELQGLAETTEQKGLFYWNRGMILSSLGRFDEARECRAHYVNTLPEDNPARLRYNEWKKLWERHLTLKDKYEGDSRKDRIVEIMANWNPIQVPMEQAKDEYSAYAILILEDCESEGSVQTFMKKVLGIMDIEKLVPISETDLEQVSKRIFEATQE